MENLLQTKPTYETPKSQDVIVFYIYAARLGAAPAMPPCTSDPIATSRAATLLCPSIPTPPVLNHAEFRSTPGCRSCWCWRLFRRSWAYRPSTSSPPSITNGWCCLLLASDQRSSFSSAARWASVRTHSSPSCTSNTASRPMTWSKQPAVLAFLISLMTSP